MNTTTIQDTLALLNKGPVPSEAHGRATRYSIALRAMAAACVLSMGFALAVGSTSWQLAAANVLKLPLVLIVPVLCSWPLGTLLGKMCDDSCSSSNLLVSQGVGILGASLFLLATSPLVVLFYHTTSTLGAIAAMIAAMSAVCIGGWLFMRAIRQRQQGVRVLIPAILMMVLYGLALIQMISVLSPILPEYTPFAGGLPGLF